MKKLLITMIVTISILTITACYEQEDTNAPVVLSDYTSVFTNKNVEFTLNEDGLYCIQDNETDQCGEIGWTAYTLENSKVTLTLNEGYNYIYFKDSVGNIANPISVVVDTIGPNLSVVNATVGGVAIIDGGSYNQNVLLSCGSDNDVTSAIISRYINSSLDLTFGQDGFIPCTSAEQIFTLDGKYTVTLSDEYGNTSEISFIIDTIAPTYEFISLSSADELFNDNGDLVELAYLRTEILQLSEVIITLDGEVIENTVLGSFMFMFTTDGEYTIKLVDLAGNETFVQLTVDVNFVFYVFYNELEEQIYLNDDNILLESAYIATSGNYYKRVELLLNDTLLSSEQLNYSDQAFEYLITQEGIYTLRLTDKYDKIVVVTFTASFS